MIINFFKDHGLRVWDGTRDYTLLGPWVVISRMYIMDNILFSTKKEMINNFPIESTHPPRSTHGGSFELPNTLVFVH